MKGKKIYIQTVDNLEVEGFVKDIKINDNLVLTYSIEVGQDNVIEITTNEIYIIISNVG